MATSHDALTERAEVVPTTGANGSSGEPVPGPVALSPLTVSALMVTKADLIAALRVYLPGLADVEAIDGDRFLLSVGPSPAEPGGR